MSWRSRIAQEILQEFRQVEVLIRASLAHLARYVFRNVSRPSVRGVEPNDANGIAVLAFQQIVDDTFELCIFDIGFAPSASNPAEVVEHEINIAINARND